MKVTYCSDLHVEFGSPKIGYDFGEGDVLILGGDITAASRLPYRFQDATSRKMQSRTQKLITATQGYSKVLYVMGNHEHYHGIFRDTKSHLEEFVKDKADNWVFLDNSAIKIGDTTFVGSTLWTDMNKENPTAMWRAEQGMNDYRLILAKDPVELTYEERHNHRTLARQACINPMFTIREHRFSWDYIKMVTGEPGNKVVITHHPITSKALNPMHSGDLLDAAYYTDYGDWLAGKENISHWISGHTHQKMDLTIGNTRCLSNPQGYPMESTFSRFKLESFEV